MQEKILSLIKKLIGKKEEIETIQIQVPPKRVEKPEEEKITFIGHSFSLKGEIVGDENLIIDGVIEGKIILKDHILTIGKRGKVIGEIYGRIVKINGNVKGSIRAKEIVYLEKIGSFRGNIFSPRISIADGAHFKGAITPIKPSDFISPEKMKIKKESERKD